MPHVLIIAEKPAAAQRIAQALAEDKPKKVTKNGAYWFEFTRSGKKHVCVPAVGHLFVLDTNDNGEWTYPVFDTRWIRTYEKRGLGYVRKYVKNMIELVRDAEDIIVATDYDTEGEVIGYNILRFLCNRNNAKRMKFSTLTRDELINSYNNVMPHIDFGQAEAGLTRHYLDFFWGINTTRALTLAMRTQTNRGFQIISSGRVQSPTLALLLQRELEIRNFVPKPFWQLELHCQVDGKEIVATYEKDRIWDKKEADKILKECEGKDAVVKKIEKRRYRQLPPFPFNTTDLQTEAYNQFKFSPRQTLNIAESLYQAGYISYPRSASQKLPPTVGYRKILEALATLPPYKKFAEELLKKEKLIPREGPKTDPAHPCVYTTWEVPDLRKLTPQQRKIYDLIVRRTLSTFADAAKRESMNVVLDVGGNKFKAVGKRTIAPGWFEIYAPYIRLKEQTLPDLKVGQELRVIKLNVLEKETQPPPRYTQGSIIKEMEKRGLGTRATRAEILQILYDRGYVTGKSIRVTKLGEAVVNVLKEFCPRIVSEELTRRFEEEMELVMQRKKRREEVVEEAKRVLIEILEKFKENEEVIGKRLLEAFIIYKRGTRIIGKCPKCGGDLIIVRSKRTGKRFVGCSNYGKGCDFSAPLPQFGTIVPLNKECPACGMPMIQVNRKGKRPLKMCISPDCPTKAGWRGNKTAQ